MRPKRKAKRKRFRDPDLQTIPGYDPWKTAGDCWYDGETADRAVWFIEHLLVHVKGEKGGQPFILEPWQRGIVKCLFGWKRPDGTRRYRESLIYVPRKNGKTAMAACILLVLLIVDHEPGAEIYSAAADQDQAALVFEQARGMAEKEPELAKRLTFYRRSIVRKQTQSVYKAISADAHTKHGYNTHAAVIDELHAQPDRDLVDVLCTSTGARRQPLIVFITTADFDRESICNEKRDYAIAVRDGVIEDGAFLPVIYEALVTDDWTDPEVWARANPNLGVSVSKEYLARECQKALDSAAYQNTFLRLHLNCRTTNDVAFLKMAAWDACGRPAAIADLAGRDCFGGLDLSTTTDTTSLCLVFPPAPNEPGPVWFMWWYWLPDETARERAREDRVPYPQWIAEGLVAPTRGRVVDYDRVRKDIATLRRIYAIRKIGADRWNASQILRQLADDGFDIVEFGQGYKDMSGPTKEFEALVIDRRLAHDGNKVARWQAANLTVEQDAAGNLKPSKRKSTERIDGMVAAVMGLGVALANPVVGSVYERRGLRWL